MTLRLRLAGPEEGESLLGFAARLGTRNGWNSLQPFLNSLGLRYTSPALLPFDVRAAGILAAANGSLPAALADVSYEVGVGSVVRVRASSLPRWMLVTGTRRVCPACLGEAAWHRWAWDVAPLPVCPRHRVLLLSACPECGRDLDWSSTSVVACTCGHDLRRARVPAVGARVARAHAACLSILEGRATPAEHGLPPRLGLGDMLAAMLALGASDAELVNAPMPTHMVKDAGQVADILAIGLGALAPWPTAFHDFLARLRTRSVVRGGRFGVQREFGRAAAWLTRLDEATPVGALLVPEIRGVLSAESKPRPSRVRDGALAPAGGFLTLTDAARRLGCAFPKMAEILRRAGAQAVSSGSGEPIQISSAVIEQVEMDRLDLLTSREAALLLGIRRMRVPAAMSVLKLAPDRRPATLLIPAVTWSKAALSRSLDRLVKVLPERRPSATLLSFGNAAGRLVRQGEAWNEASARLLAGEVQAVAQDPRRRGLARLLYRLEDIEGLDRAKAGLTITEAGARLGINSELAHLLVRHSLLDVESSRRGRTVSEAAIDRFRETYVLPARLGLDAGHHKGWMASRLKAAGCEPVLGPAQGSRHLVFLRRDVLAILETLP